MRKFAPVLIPATLLAVLLGGVLISAPMASPQRGAAAGASRTKVFLRNGGRVDWSKKHNRLAFDRAGSGGFFDIYVINPDGSGERCLTCDHPDLPNRHIGNPAWSPSGEWIVMQVQKSRTNARYGQPGFGINNDLWALNVATSEVYELHRVGRRWRSPPGVLHPHFSNRGDRLVWSERIGGGGFNGIWKLKIANFDVRGGEPRLRNVKELSPGDGLTFYESHGFSPDDKQILFSGAGGSLKGIDIYRLDLGSGELINLTDSPDEWDEHAHWSPDGRSIVWMSNRDQQPPAMRPLKTDYWIMRSDGSRKRRLTWFNDPGHAQYAGNVVAAADATWSPDGKRLIGFLISDNAGEEGLIVEIEVEDAAR